jgi:hypothetical protein
MNGKVVLSDQLLVCYETYHANYSTEVAPKTIRRRFERLLSSFEPPYITNLTQLKRIKSDLPFERYQRLVEQFANISIKDQSLEDMALMTTYKLILTDDGSQTELPYLNIKHKNMQKPYAVSLAAEQSRQALIIYLRTLCSSAQTVLICDNYIGKNWARTQSFFTQILPRKALNIEFVDTASTTSVHPQYYNRQFITADYAKTIWSQWQVNKKEQTQYNNRHDRYLLIDNKLEVMLSSGFDYLFNHNKEITCVFREV